MKLWEVSYWTRSDGRAIITIEAETESEARKIADENYEKYNLAQINTVYMIGEKKESNG